MLGTAEELVDSVDSAAKAILVWLEEEGGESLKTKEVKEALAEKFSKQTIDRALNQLVSQGKLVKPERRVYAIPKDSPTCQHRQCEIGKWVEGGNDE